MHFKSSHEHILLLVHHFYFAWTEYSNKCHIIIQISNIESSAKQFGHMCQTVTEVDQSCKSNNASVRHPPMHRSEQKCAISALNGAPRDVAPPSPGGTAGCQYKSPSPRGAPAKGDISREKMSTDGKTRCHTWRLSGATAGMTSRLRCKRRSQ